MSRSDEIQGMSIERLTHLTRQMQSYVDDGKIAGAVVTVARRGEVAFAEAIGQADIATNKRMRHDTLFRIYSMTKALTCTAVLILMEEGRLRLGDPVARFLPAFAEMGVWDPSSDGGGQVVKAARPITIYDLLTHTSGLSYGFGAGHVDDLYRSVFWDIDPEDAKASVAAGKIDPVTAAIASLEVAHRQTLDEIIESLTKLPLAHQPGSAYRYSVATDVLGSIVEHISGSTLPEFFQRRIFEPLGMADTAFHVSVDKADRLATLYGRDAEGTLVVTDAAETSLFLKPPICALGGSGLISTAADYLRFCTMLLEKGKAGDDRLLSRKSVELMTTDHMPSSFPGWGDGISGQGFGVGVQRHLQGARGPGSPGTFSGGGAAQTSYWIDPAEQLAGVVMTQLLPAGVALGEDVRTLAYSAVAD